MMRSQVRTLTPLATLLVLLAGACRDPQERAADPWGRERDPALAPVSDPNAQTVKQLSDAGFVVVGQRETACDAGPEIACDGFDAVYLGKQTDADRVGAAEFACPGTDAPPDNWRCRKLDPPYVPNDGFAPVAANGS